jgi:tetratricopeptide (TPR) repeat protein
MRIHRSLLACVFFPALAASLAASDVAGSSGSAASAPPGLPASLAAQPAAATVTGSQSPTAPAQSPGLAMPAASADTPPSVSKPPDDGDILTEVAAQATPLLKELVARENILLPQVGKDDQDQDRVQRDIQTLVFDYDAFLRRFPNFTPGYVTYGLLLGKVGMRRQSVAILLKANQLNPDIPIVKNQLGDYLAEEGEPIEAANYFISAIRLEPNEPLYHYQLGKVLSEARDDFLKSGQWTAAQIDRSMLEAFRRASELAPDNIVYAYRYARSFSLLAEPRWDEALKVWGALEDRCSPGLEKETIRLQAANILIKQKKFDHARLLLTTVTIEALKVQKQKLLDQLPANVEK